MKLRKIPDMVSIYAGKLDYMVLDVLKLIYSYFRTLKEAIESIDITGLLVKFENDMQGRIWKLEDKTRLRFNELEKNITALEHKFKKTGKLEDKTRLRFNKLEKNITALEHKLKKTGKANNSKTSSHTSKK